MGEAHNKSAAEKFVGLRESLGPKELGTSLEPIDEGASWLVRVDFLPPSCWLRFCVPSVSVSRDFNFIFPAFSFQGKVFVPL